MPRGQIGEVCNLAIMVSVFVANPAHASPCKPGGTVFNTAVSNFIFPFGLWQQSFRRNFKAGDGYVGWPMSLLYI